MEKRILMAFALSFMVFTLYLKFFAPPPQSPLVPEGGQPGSVVEDAGRRPLETSRPPSPSVSPATQPSEVLDEGSEAEAPSGEVRADTIERTIEVNTPLYRAQLLNRGARIRSFILKEYADEQGNSFEMVPIEASETLRIHPLALDLEDPAMTDEVKDALFETSRQRVDLRPGETGELSFDWANGRGLTVSKKVRFSADTYRLAVEVSVQQDGTELSKTMLFGPGVGDQAREGRYVQPKQGVIQSNGEMEFFSLGDIEDFPGASVGVQLAGVSAHYFAGLMVPARGSRYAAMLETPYKITNEEGDVWFRDQSDADREAARLAEQQMQRTGRLERPQKSQRLDFITAGLEAANAPLAATVFMGPKETDRLAALAPGMESVVDYGSWMRYLALPLRQALLWIHGYVGNFGWSIVLLTISINVLLVPLKHHSYVSMRKMQKLSPQIKRIQERYKKLKPTDPRRQDMNKEVYGLYKEHNVSPLSGCLPMLLMIPFFFAFYRLLMVSIELRQAPWILWIQDLSNFDPFFVLPILMGVSQVAIQRLSPQTSADPVQAKIMAFMPVVFVFILAWAPAGLVLYWFVNNLVSLGQQTVTNRMLTEGEQEQASTAGGKKKKKKKASAQTAV